MKRADVVLGLLIVLNVVGAMWNGVEVAVQVVAGHPWRAVVSGVVCAVNVAAVLMCVSALEQPS